MTIRKPSTAMVDAMRDAAARPYGEFANNGSIAPATKEAIAERGLAEWLDVDEVYGFPQRSKGVKRLFLSAAGRAYLDSQERPRMTLDRDAIHTERLAILQTAADERDTLISLLQDGGQLPGDAAAAVDRLIIAMRHADAIRLLHASFEDGASRRLKYVPDAVGWLTEHRHDAPVTLPAEQAAEQADETASEEPGTPAYADADTQPPGMDYTIAVTRPDGQVDDDVKRYNDATAVHLLRTALGQGYTLTAAARSSVITLTLPGRNTIVLRPARALSRPTAAQRREILALSSSPGPIVWHYGRSNTIALRDGQRTLAHQTTMALINGGYLSERSGNGNPAELSLLARLTLGAAERGDEGRADAFLSALLTNVYRRTLAA
ncbi:hypothetical protein [Streptomyces sp. cg35]|uniref:hypothetical protein n=1 Tax=Streptomyces sp. cg35 TaxID=3421650 RepID=UPI003D16DC1D